MAQRPAGPATPVQAATEPAAPAAPPQEVIKEVTKKEAPRRPAEGVRRARDRAVPPPAPPEQHAALQTPQPAAPPAAHSPPTPAETPAPPSEPHRARFIGNTVVPAQELEGLVRDLTPLTGESISTLLSRVQGHYAARGYPFARAQSRGQRDGELEVLVLEGHVRSVRPVGFHGTEEHAVMEAFQPVVHRGVARSQELQEATRTLSGRHRIIAQYRYEPGPDPGSGELVVERRSFGGTK
jgi:hemolysin activation/secretion protein